ncbi:MAG: exodeoxyribonuclease VII small subunit [Candidatus Dormibacteraeota bacterium]|nr:exodeoxyribonuclease VII small subunit [Candidatus Dormibacteraeota bacterium]MBV9524314.1 exodeoxyribonuclease VII small subunit [Candidatus Dormibacteraeota bacterium]
MQQPEVETMSFEAAVAELDSLIERLEAGSIALDDAIAAYERGAALARHCEALLDRTERRVNALVVGGDGSVREAPLQIGEPAPAEGGLFAPDAGRAARPRARQVDPDDVPF